ncbi:MAG: TIGR02996 domain-containing protein [Kofleriaceae bacterium]
MASLMAVISKVVFESDTRDAALGDVLPIARYTSANKALALLAEPGAKLFLFTVRPPDEQLWLVAILADLEHDGASWVGRANTTPVTNIAGIKRQIRFASGVGIKAKPGALGMSLQTPRALTDADVALLEGAAGTRRKPAPKPPAVAKPRLAKPATAKPAGSSDLGAATALIVAKKLEQALAKLLAIWANRPLPRLGDAIGALDEAMGRPWGPLFLDKSDLHARFLRIRKLAKQPRDPRFARALLELVRDTPYTSTSSRGFWTAVFGVIDELDDPRAIAALASARAGWKIRPDQRTWLEGQADRLLAAYASRYPTGAPEPAASEATQLAALERAIGAAMPAAHDTARRDALLAEVYANPDDDGPRLVFADFLGEAGDPRGELITLQLVPDPTPVQHKRIKQLLAANERAWIGPLEPVIAQAGVEFRRGFLAGCRVKLKNEMAAQKYGTDPSWATVERLRFTGSRFSYQAFSSQSSGVFFVSAAMRSLRDVNLHDAKDLAALLAVATPWKLERLATSTEVSLGKAGLALLAKTTKLPMLAAIEMLAPPRGWLASARFGKRLREVVLGLGSANDERGPVTWLPELERLPALERASILASRLRGTYPRWTFARDARKQLSIATLVTTPDSFDLAVRIVAAFPPTQLTELTVELAPAQRRDVKVTPAQRAAMTDAIDRQRRLTTRDVSI